MNILVTGCAGYIGSHTCVLLLEAGYDVIFNYIIKKDKINELKKYFNEFKFVVLMVDEETILKRDSEIPIDCQMKERCIVLLNSFKNTKYKKDFFLDTTNLSVEETININEALLCFCMELFTCKKKNH